MGGLLLLQRRKSGVEGVAYGALGVLVDSDRVVHWADYEDGGFKGRCRHVSPIRVCLGGPFLLWFGMLGCGSFCVSGGGTWCSFWVALWVSVTWSLCVWVVGSFAVHHRPSRPSLS